MKRKIVKWSKIAIVLPLIILVIYLDNGHFSWEEFNHWIIHVAACVLVCETIHSWTDH